MMNPLFSISVGLLRQSLESSLRLGAAAANVTSTLFYASRKVPVEYAPIGVLRLDHSLHVLSSNPAARDLIGSQLTSGSSLHQILSYDSVEALLARIGECHAQGTPFATKVELPPADSGSHLPIPISVHIDQLQKGPGRRSRLVATLTQLPLASLQVISDTRTRLLESCACEQDPEKLLSSILNELRTIVPFDVATFHEYTVDEDNKTRVSRIRFVFDPGEPSFRWPVRWTQVEPRVHQLATGERPWIGDLEEFLKEIGSDTLQNAPNIVAARKRGLKSFLILALKEANTVSAALTLSSQKSNFFGAYERELLDAVDMEKVLQLVRAAYRRQADVFSLELGRLFHSGAEPPQIAKQFVEKLAKEFDWEYVGIFRVAHTRGQFELVEQYDKAANLRLSPNYTQSLSAGVLGNVLREGRAIRIPDVNIDPAPFGYIKLSEARSCLCYPIRIRDKVEWILDCESSQVSGFGAADQRALEAVINGLETTLSFWFESRLNQALLGRIHQGVVVVDESGGIERLNEAAQLLLGLAIGEDAKQRTLYDFGADEQAKAVLRRERDASDRHIRLRGNDGVERRALVSAYFAPEAFNRWIWLLTDVADQRWQVGLHYLRALAQEVAGETRGPLLLANSLVNSAGDLLKQPEILDQRGLPTKAVEFWREPADTLQRPTLPMNGSHRCCVPIRGRIVGVRSV